MNILFCLILWTNISHSITTSIPQILKKSSPHINIRRSSKPVTYYHNSSDTMRLLLSDNIKSNTGPVNMTESKRNHKQNKSFLQILNAYYPQLAHPPFLQRGEVEPPTKFSKRGGALDRISTFRGGLLGKRGVTFFRGVAIFT